MIGGTVTAVDLEIICFLARMRLATALQLSCAMAMRPDRVYRRTRFLHGAGLIRYERVMAGRPGVYLATRRGVALAGCPVRAGRMDLGTYRHDLAMVSLSLELLGSHAGSRWRSEREIRSSIDLGEFGHVPDGVLMRSTDAVAVELELTPKGFRRLGRILRYYARCREYGEVWYFLTDAAALTRYQRLMRPYSHIRAHLWHLPREADAFA